MTHRLTPADDYRELRYRLAELQAVEGRLTLQELFSAFDSTWRTLRRCRRRALKAARQEPSTENVDDLYSLVCQVYAGRPSDPLCESCRAAVPREWGQCRFCGGEMTKKIERTTVRDLDAVTTNAPDWDIDYGAAEILSTAGQRNKTPPPTAPAAAAEAPVARPVTKRDLIPGPTGNTGDGDYRRRMTARNKANEAMLAYARKQVFAKGFPYDQLTLDGLKIADLRSIAMLCPGMTRPELDKLNQPAMLAFILASQPQAPIEPGPAPFGNVPKAPPGRGGDGG